MRPVALPTAVAGLAAPAPRGLWQWRWRRPTGGRGPDHDRPAPTGTTAPGCAPGASRPGGAERVELTSGASRAGTTGSSRAGTTARRCPSWSTCTATSRGRDPKPRSPGSATSPSRRVRRGHPQGNSDLPYWNAVPHDDLPDDVAFVDAVIDDVAWPCASTPTGSTSTGSPTAPSSPRWSPASSPTGSPVATVAGLLVPDGCTPPRRCRCSRSRAPRTGTCRRRQPLALRSRTSSGATTVAGPSTGSPSPTSRHRPRRGPPSTGAPTSPTGAGVALGRVDLVRRVRRGRRRRPLPRRGRRSHLAGQRLQPRQRRDPRGHHRRHRRHRPAWSFFEEHPARDPTAPVLTPRPAWRCSPAWWSLAAVACGSDPEPTAVPSTTTSTEAGGSATTGVATPVALPGGLGDRDRRHRVHLRPHRHRRARSSTWRGGEARPRAGPT